MTYNILLTGGKGFLGREIVNYFQNHKTIKIISTDRTSLDPTSYDNVKNFFLKNKVDFVLHTAVKGGKRGRIDTIQDLFDNIAMFENLLSFRSEYKAIFNFCSGAAFDRKSEINDAKEEQIFNFLPEDYYGLSKNLIARKISILNSNAYNFRLFGCFGKAEEEQRFIRNSVNNLSAGRNIEIHQDKEMDFIYTHDVCRVIEYFIENIDNDKLDKDYNLCYKKKHRLGNIAQIILDNAGLESKNVVVLKKGMAEPYTGDSSRLDKLNINFIGLEEGIRECQRSWNRF